MYGRLRSFWTMRRWAALRDRSLGQPASHQARLPEGVAPIAVAQCFVLLIGIEHLARIAQDQFVRLLLARVEGLQTRVTGYCGVEHVEPVKEITSLGLLLLRDPG